jgi:hypothetical protein
MPLPQKPCQSCVFAALSSSFVALALALLSISAAAQVSANPSNLAFGDVQIGTKSTLPVVLTNNGNSVVQITRGRIQGTGFSVDAKLPIILNPGQNFPLSVTFAPQADNPYSATVSGSNSSGILVSVPLTGNGTQSGYSVGLSWNPSPSPPQIVGYNVYRGIQNNGPYTKINSILDSATAYTDYTVLAGMTYYYVTTSVDSAGQESPYSNQTEAYVP